MQPIHTCTHHPELVSSWLNTEFNIYSNQNTHTANAQSGQHDASNGGTVLHSKHRVGPLMFDSDINCGGINIPCSPC